MWSEILGGILKSGTSGPKVIQTETTAKEDWILYGFAIVVLLVVAVVFIKVTTK